MNHDPELVIDSAVVNVSKSGGKVMIASIGINPADVSDVTVATRPGYFAGPEDLVKFLKILVHSFEHGQTFTGELEVKFD